MVTEGRLIASTLTRVFVRQGARTPVGVREPYATLTDDSTLVERVQADFVREHMEELRRRGVRVAV
jgi:hypothetical protein